MTASAIGYARVLGWVKAMCGGGHGTVVGTVAWLVLCLLAGQGVAASVMARALPAAASGSARSRLRRVQRGFRGPELTVATLAPNLVATALALLPAGAPVRVALDTTRVGPWEVWLAGVVFGGHVLPVAWAVVPYPWPKGAFRRTTLALVAELQRAFPPGCAWELVADRGFPSAALFGRLAEGETGFTVRLRLTDWLEVGGVYAQVRDHLEAGRLRPGARVAATIGSGAPDRPKVTAWVVVNETVPAPPRHKRNPATARERAKRAKRRAQHLANKGRRSKPPSEAAQRYAQTWVLFTTAPTVAAAVAAYAARMPVEETFRDWHSGWGLRRAAKGLETAAAVARMVGVVALAYRLQVELGWRLSRDPVGRARRAQWTVSDRVSYFWCGGQLFTDPGYDWSTWLAGQWDQLYLPHTLPQQTRLQEAA